MLLETSDINARLGFHLRFFRERERMSCLQVGLLIEASPCEVSAYERGEARISAERLIRASNAFRVPLMHFFA